MLSSCGLLFLYLQMEELDLGVNEDIDDEGAAMLLGFFSNVEWLRLQTRNISPQMQDKLWRRANEVGCSCQVYDPTKHDELSSDDDIITQ